MDIYKIFIALFFTVILFSCKEEKKPQVEHYPNFGKVNLEKIFTKDDAFLQNRAAVDTLLNHYYTTIWEESDLWGGILVAKGDDILLEKYRGLSKNSKPIDSETPLHIASVSKPITAMMVLKLVEAKKLNLDDAFTKFFPKFPYPKVTIFTLLNHRSGLPRYEHFIEQIKPEPQELKKKFLTNEDVLNMLIKYQPALARETDTGFMYCNTNYALLALLVEKITGEKFPEVARKMVFEPLEMEHSYIFQEKDTATATPSFFAKDFREYPLDRLDAIYGDKNVYTTPRDLFKFSKAMHSVDFLNDSSKGKIFIPYSNEKKGVNNYGLGFRMKLFDNGKKLTYHNGWWHGSNSVFVHLPESKVTIIALGNKYSRRIYSAMSLSALFEDFPFQIEETEH